MDAFRKILIAIVSRQATNDMSVRQLAVLFCLSDGPRTVRDLAEATSIAKPSISRAGDKLEEMGFARREDDPDDRRSVLLTLTPLGKRFLTSVAKP